jgi:hypothetical protein
MKEKVTQVLLCEPSQSSARIQSRIMEPLYLGLSDTLLACIKSGKVTEEIELSSALGSLDIVQLTMDVQRSCAALGIEPTAPINSVGDLLRLLTAIDSKREHNDKSPWQTP